MAATFIPALVIKHNNDVYLTPDLVVGVTMVIPTPGAGGVPDGDYWAVPIANYGVTTGFNFVPTTPSDDDAPTLQSFHVFRLITRFGNDVWYARGTTTTNAGSPIQNGYVEVSQDAECCDETPRALPTDVPGLFPCQVACEWNTNEAYFFVLGLGTDNGTYTASGYINGEALPTITGATGAALQTQLNSQWTNVGSPNVVITWTVANERAIGVITSGTGEDVLCAKVTSA